MGHFRRGHASPAFTCLALAVCLVYLSPMIFVGASRSVPAAVDPFVAANPGRGMTGRLPRPPMGWCTYNAFHGSFDATDVVENGEKMVELGMPALGYEFVNLDIGFWAKPKTKSTSIRNATGHLIPDPARFPKGLGALGESLHGMGLKYGLYSDAGTSFCGGAGKPGGLGYERQDAEAFAEWGADYVKVDACGMLEGNTPASAAQAQKLASLWRKELDAAAAARGAGDEGIVFSNCHVGCMLSGARRGGWQPWCQAASDLWRSSRDIHGQWCIHPTPRGQCGAGVMHNLDSLAGNADKAGPGKGWNDPDLLVVGLKEKGYKPLTDAESRAHFALWCVTSSPLIMSVDLRTASAATIEKIKTLTNAEAIAVNQAWGGSAGDRISAGNPTGGEVWAKPLPGGGAGVVLLNRGDTAVDITAEFESAGAACAPTCAVRDLWAHADLGSSEGSFTAKGVPPHGHVFLKLSTPP